MSVQPVNNISPYIQKYSKPLPTSAPNPIFRGEIKATHPPSRLSLHALLAKGKFNNAIRDYVHKMESIKADRVNVHQYKNVEMFLDGKPNN